MKNTLLTACAAMVAIGLPSVASANGVAVEANGARAQQEWGAELGAGYNFTFHGFTLRPMAGVFLNDSDGDDDRDVKVYGRIEGTYTLLGTTEFGAGARISSDQTRLYGTVSFPLLPRIRAKANVGDRYYALGLRADF